MSGDHVTHQINVKRDYYIVQAGRSLEVRARDTHAVLEVLKPPREWGNEWLWSSCGFDGLRCVAVDEIRFMKANQKRTRLDAGVAHGEQEQQERESDAGDAETDDEPDAPVAAGSAASSNGAQLSRTDMTSRASRRPNPPVGLFRGAPRAARRGGRTTVRAIH